MTRFAVTRPLVLLALPLLLAAPGCKWKKEAEQLKSDNTRLAQEKQQLEQQVASTGAESAEMNATLDEVQKSLEELRAKELKVISSSLEIAQEGKPARGRRETLKQEIDEIRAAVQTNLDKLAQLEKEKKASQKKAGQLQGQVTTLERLVGELRSQLEEKQQTIAQLEEKVLQMSQTIEQQAGTIKERETVIDTQIKELNKAYVVIGDRKTLRAKGLVEKRGSVLGMGGGFRRTGKFDPEAFRELDLTQETSFPIPAPAKKVYVLSDHPKESYQLTENDPKSCTLTITDAAAFWRGSKYLIIMTP